MNINLPALFPLAIFLVLLLTGCGGAHRQAEEPRGSGYSGRCGDFNQQIEKFWSAADQASVRASVLKLEPKLAEQLEQGVHRNAAEWVSAQEARCDGNGSEGTLSEEDSKKVWHCLDGALLSQRAFVDVIKQGEIRNIDSYDYALIGIREQIVGCGEPAIWQAYTNEPSDEAATQLKTELARLFALRKLRHTGHSVDISELLLLAEKSGSARLQVASLNEAARAEAGGNWPKALERVMQAVKLLEGVPDLEFQKFHTKLDLAYILVAQANFQGALPLFHELVKAGTLFKSQQMLLAEAQIGLGISLSQVGREAEGLQVLLGVERLFERNYGVENSLVAPIKFRVAIIQGDLGKFKESKKSFQEVLRLLKTQRGDAVDLGVLYTNLAWAHESLGELDEALVNYAQSIRILQARPDPEPEILGIALMQSGLIHSQRANWEPAIRALNEALTPLEQAWGAKDIRIGNLCSNLGNTYLQLEEYSKAYVFLTRALEIQREHSQVEETAISATYYGLGVYYLNRGEFDEAFAQLMRAYTIEMELFGPDGQDTQFTVGRITELCEAGHQPACDALN